MSDQANPTTTPDAEKFLREALAEMENEAPLDLADDAELGLPATYDAEVAAAIAIEHADNLMAVRWKILNAKLNHQDDEVKKLAASEMASRAILTKIKREIPQAYTTLHWVLARRAENAQKEREKMDNAESPA